MNAAERLSAELGEETARPAQKRSANNNGAPSLFTLANGVDTLRLLGKLGIEHDEQFATCPGCGEPGALICENGGLKCLHERCSRIGPTGFKGFRNPVGIVEQVKGLDPKDAAVWICGEFGIEIPKYERKSSSTEEPPPDDAPWGRDEDDPHAPHSDAPPDKSEDSSNPKESKSEQKPSSSALESKWIDLGNALEFVTEQPPPQTWLLKQWHGQQDHGVFPRGKTGLFTATGGVGKTYALIQLAIAVASGGFWLDFRAVQAGHVLVALGEEDAEEAWRRIWRALNAAEMDIGQRKNIASHLHLLPLHGVPIALTCSPSPGVIATSDFATELRRKLDGFGVDWSLLILDPLSRWAGGGIESNNEAATRFVQVVETLTTVRGNPSVLLAHHSSQTSTRAGESDARGVTGIRDGFRWQASMDAIVSPDGTIDGVHLKNPKSNYSMRFQPLLLARNTEPGIEGTLRIANDFEAETLRAALPKDRQSADERAKARQERSRGAFQTNESRVLDLLPVAPAHISGMTIETELRAAGTPMSDKTIRGILDRLVIAGRAVDLSDGAQSKPRQWARRIGADDARKD